MAKKQIWTKISGLTSDILEEEGEEVTIIPEIPRREKLKKKKGIIQKKQEEEKEEWLPDSGQGQLVVDVYERGNELVIESTIAGVGIDNIDVTVEPDLIVIRGERQKKEKPESVRYYYQECFWGKFARTLVLPCPVKPEQVKANLKNGILTIVLPKAEEKNQSVEIGE